MVKCAVENVLAALQSAVRASAENEHQCEIDIERLMFDSGEGAFVYEGRTDGGRDVYGQVKVSDLTWISIRGKREVGRKKDQSDHSVETILDRLVDDTPEWIDSVVND